MHRSGPTLVLAPTDLSNFLGCHHRTALDLAVAEGLRERPWHHAPILEVLRQRGLEHEHRYVEALHAEGVAVTDLSEIQDHADRAGATLDAMHRGDEVIVQGVLADGVWRGLPDILRRVAAPSALGTWSYEVADTKLARETRGATILQLGLYSELLAALQGRRPDTFTVVTPEPATSGTLATGHRLHQYRVDDYVAYVRWARQQMIATVELGIDRIAAAYYPEPVTACEVCRWAADCAKRRRADDHLSLVAGITAAQRHELESRSIATLTALATLETPLPFRPHRGATASYVKVQDQARLQYESRGRTPPLHELLDVEPGRGLSRLPDPTPGDLFLDLEGDPLAVDGGREYLFGLASADGGYRAAWALAASDEKAGFEWVMDTIDAAAREHPDMHVYHYAPYEPGALKRLMGRYATRERELDALLRSGRLVDLYAVVRQGLRAGIERYSIKNLEPLYGFDRDVELPLANRCRAALEKSLDLGATDLIPPVVRQTVERYNRDDCISTLRLRDWLEGERSSLVAKGVDVPRPGLASGEAPATVDERAQRVEALRARLLEGIPEFREDRSAAQQGRWLLAYALDYHRREDRAAWWEYFRLCGLDEEDLLDERGAVAGLEFVERRGFVPHKRTGKPTRSVIDRYRYPPQDMEIDVEDRLSLQDGAPFGEVVDVDRQARTIDIRKGPSVAEIHPRAVFVFSHVSARVIEDALYRIGTTVADGGSGPAVDAAMALLAADSPRLRTGSLVRQAGETATQAAVRVVAALDRTVLPVQGPPGSGKTYTGARMIADLVRQGKRVGVTATSHTVLHKLLEDAVRAGGEQGRAIRAAHKDRDKGDRYGQQDVLVRLIADDNEALAALTDGEVDVLGGTAWLWTRPDFASKVDVLFVDEAGQMALANVVAAAQASDSIVLLGDPQQLEHPTRGSHPDGLAVSALEHMLCGERTIADDRGIFLPETWRLAPGICRFTSELFYENRLGPHAGLERQCLRGVADLADSGLAFCPVEHEGNQQASPEEVDAVEALVDRLMAPEVQWVDDQGTVHPLQGADIVVVAPYNAQVNRLAERIAARGVRVGTVDRFQGQEAAVAIYSMATSNPADAPHGLEFLYSLNRLNVATSRARCLAIVVASPRLFEVECETPHRMRLANGLCRYRELAAEVHP